MSAPAGCATCGHDREEHHRLEDGWECWMPVRQVGFIAIACRCEQYTPADTPAAGGAAPP